MRNRLGITSWFSRALKWGYCGAQVALKFSFGCRRKGFCDKGLGRTRFEKKFEIERGGHPREANTTTLAASSTGWIGLLAVGGAARLPPPVGRSGADLT